MQRDNPYRNPAMRLELGERALAELMTRDDWREIVARLVKTELAPYLDSTSNDEVG